MISLDKVVLAHGIHGVSCELPKNRLIGILGANGAGKSSLLKAVAGIVNPSAGHIVIAGQDSRHLSYASRSALMAYLAQDTPVYWSLSVFDVIALGAAQPLSACAEREKVRHVAEICDVKGLLNQPIDTLSGGERARVHLARCLMKDAPILLADEPIASLDPYYQITMMALLKVLSQRMTCVVVLHHLSLAYEYCDDIVLLEQGKLVAAGQTQDVMVAENLATALQISATINPNIRQITAINAL